MKKTFLTLVCLLTMAATAQAQHKLGEIIELDGVKGMVFKLDASGEHGLAFSVDKSEESWLADKTAKYETGAFYEDDGEKNLKKIEEYIKAENQQWEDFPYFKWCKELGPGWYPPAKDELSELINFITGNGLNYNHKRCKKLSEILDKAGGDKLYSGFTKSPYLYFTSTEAEGGLVWALVFAENVGSSLVGQSLLGGGPKGKYKLQPYQKRQPGGKSLNIVGNRAIHKF